MSSISFVLHNEAGLHARPASIFVKAMNSFESEVELSNLTTNNGPVNGKSILNVLGLAAEKNHQVHVVIKGHDEAQALEKLKELVGRGFQE